MIGIRTTGSGLSISLAVVSASPALMMADSSLRPASLRAAFTVVSGFEESMIANSTTQPGSRSSSLEWRAASRAELIRPRRAAPSRLPVTSPMITRLRVAVLATVVVCRPGLPLRVLFGAVPLLCEQAVRPAVPTRPINPIKPTRLASAKAGRLAHRLWVARRCPVVPIGSAR